MCHTRTAVLLAGGAAGRQFFIVVVLCVLAVLMAVRGQQTDRMLMFPLGLVRAQRVQRHKKKYTLGTCARCWMLRKPGDLPYSCPRPKKLERLATRDTLHGPCPNLRQRDPNGRIVPTPPNVSNKGASTKRCVRSRKKNDNYTYTYEYRIIGKSRL